MGLSMLATIGLAKRVNRLILGGLIVVLLPACSGGASLARAVGAGGPLPPALQLWAAFPVHAAARPLVLVGGPLENPSGVYGNGETKLALGCGDFQSPTGLPTGPGRAGGYRLITAKTAFAQLQPQDRTGMCAQPHGLLTLSEARLGQAMYETDRGPKTLPAWRFSFTGVEGPIPVLAVAPDAEWLPPGVRSGSSHDIGARVGRDQRTLTFGFTGAQFEDGPCGLRYAVALEESPTAVMVTLTSHRTADDSTAACTLVGVIRHASASLAAPLGNRVLIDDQGYPMAAISS
jgi:hypothetical protein